MAVEVHVEAGWCRDACPTSRPRSNEYDELGQYDEHEFRAMTDREYGQVAGEMGFADGSISYTVYRQL